MKANKEHRVPLSAEAVAVLAAAKALENASGLLFPSERGGELSSMTLGKLLRGKRHQGGPPWVPEFVPRLVRRKQSRSPVGRGCAGPPRARRRGVLFQK